jgi:hypothetical protein
MQYSDKSERCVYDLRGDGIFEIMIFYDSASVAEDFGFAWLEYEAYQNSYNEK